VVALFHDLILTAGVYALVHFEVTPGTVVGLLTILGYSLYDTVVVFDKVDENTRGILGTSRHTYGEAANLAVNQTLMRSINTSLIGLLPVAGLLFIGAGVLGVGTLEDLALVLFVGMITGAYSSLFLATPWLVDFKMLDPRYRNHANRVLAKRSSEAKTAGVAGKPAATGRLKASTPAATASDLEDESEDTPARIDALAGASTTPRVGTKPPVKRPGANRPGGARSNRSGGKRRH
jgi:preprotein translocase subunit SecF